MAVLIASSATVDGWQQQGMGSLQLHQMGDVCREDEGVSRSNTTNYRRFRIVVDGVQHGKGCKKTIELPPGDHTVTLIPDILGSWTENVRLDTRNTRVVDSKAVRYEPKADTTLQFHSEPGAEYELKWASSTKFNWFIGMPLKVEIRRKKPKQVLAKGLLEWNESSVGK